MATADGGLRADTAGLAEQVAQASWYHVIDLGDGLVTPGHFDCRSVAKRIPLPVSLAGKRCLDVGTWDGFWAFEMEKRGAREVIAVDLDDPNAWDWPSHGRETSQTGQRAYLSSFKAGDRAFDLAHRALDSRVLRQNLSVYDLTPERIGTFDFVFLGTLLMHLRDPVRALECLRSVCSGQGVIADGVEAIPSWLRPRTPSARLEGLSEPWWWQPNRAGLHRMVQSAGWQILDATPVYFLPTGPTHPKPALSPAWIRALGSARGRERLLIRLLGVPHAAVLVKPDAT